MKAIVLKDFGGTEQLEIKELSEPNILEDEVIVRTRAISINPVDVKTRKGKGQAARLKSDPPMILGWDVSGEVVAVGDSVRTFKPGDEVFGMINLPGHARAYAEYVAAPEQHLAIKPGNISHEEAAGASLAAMTAWQALVDHAHVKPGQRVLIHAASGGVGHFAVQIAKHLGAYVIGTSSAANKELVLSLGADEHIDYKKAPFEEQLEKVDVVLDALGGDNIDRSLKVFRAGGTIVSLPSGVSESVTEKAAAQNKRGIFFLVKSNPDDIRRLAALLGQGIIRTHISAVYKFDEISKAHDHIESGRSVGKIIVHF